MITFRPLTADEFAAFTDYFIADYAAEIVSNDRISQEDALRQARQTILSSFPDGEKRPGTLFCLSLTPVRITHNLSVTCGTNRT